MIMTDCEFKIWNDNPICVFEPGEKYSFSFGLYKAKKFIELIHNIRAYVNMYSPEVQRKMWKEKQEIQDMALVEDCDYPIHLSLYKARMIVNNVSTIQSFISKYDGRSSY